MISEAYRRALAKRAISNKKLEAANAAFGSQDTRLKAMYGDRRFHFYNDQIKIRGEPFAGVAYYISSGFIHPRMKVDSWLYIWNGKWE